MKKALLTFGIILIALAVMAPGPPDKAEKLRFDDEGWDYEPDTAELVVSMLCQFGMATAGEHADFKAQVEGTITNLAGEGGYLIGSFSTLVDIEPGDTIDVVNNGWELVSIQPARLGLGSFSWNGEDDGSGYVFSGSLTLLGPSGNVISSSEATDLPITTVDGTPFRLPSVKVDSNNWDYDSATNAIIAPLLADAYNVDYLGSEGFKVQLDLIIMNADWQAGDLILYASGTDDIVRVDDDKWEYVSIQPAHLDSVSWNGDDDGNGYVASGKLFLLDRFGNVIASFDVKETPIFTIGDTFNLPTAGCTGCDTAP